jgi:hypothetical protein
VAHAYNPSYSESRDQEDRGFKPAQTNSLRTCLEKTLHKKRADGMAQGVGPESKPQYHKKKKKKKKRVQLVQVINGVGQTKRCG